MCAGHTEVILYLFMMVIFGSYNPTYVLYWPVCYCWVRAGLNMTHRSREKQTLNMQLVHVVCIQQLHMWSTSPLLCTQTYPLRQMSLDKLWPWNEEKEKILYIIIRMSSSTRIFFIKLYTSYDATMLLWCFENYVLIMTSWIRSRPPTGMQSNDVCMRHHHSIGKHFPCKRKGKCASNFRDEWVYVLQTRTEVRE